MLYEGVGREMSELDHDGEEEEREWRVRAMLCVGFVRRGRRRAICSRRPQDWSILRGSLVVWVFRGMFFWYQVNVGISRRNFVRTECKLFLELHCNMFFSYKKKGWNHIPLKENYEGKCN